MNRNASSDLSKHTLAAIPSLFGQLAYLASLRNPKSGRYEHYGFAMVFGEKDMEKALRTSHQKLFQDWLSYNMEQQKADLDTYFSNAIGEPEARVDYWLENPLSKDLFPQNSRPAERQLFTADLLALLWIFKNGSAGQPAHSTAWQHQ
jgi:hypothetical protein